jgi:hypothetical protein
MTKDPARRSRNRKRFKPQRPPSSQRTVQKKNLGGKERSKKRFAASILLRPFLCDLGDLCGKKSSQKNKKSIVCSARG